MTSPLPRIVIFIPWFGRWPAWMRFYLASCRANPTIDFVLITDCGPVDDLPPNVRLLEYSLIEYRDHVSRTLGITCRWTEAYKMCDFGPALADLHPELVAGYSHWAFGDIDVIYGDIRSIYGPIVLEYDIISSHIAITAGHLTLIKNRPELNRAFRKVRGWKNLLARPDHRGFDEFQWSHLFTPVFGSRWERLKQRIRSPRVLARCYFVEQHSTALGALPWIDGTTNFPKTWYWDQGKLTADGAGDRGFLYLHFTNWHSSRWTKPDDAAWQKLDRIDHLPPGRPTRFKISARGFEPWDGTKA